VAAAALEQFREIASELGTEVAYGEDKKWLNVKRLEWRSTGFFRQWLSVSPCFARNKK
jgi:hypothetical protein